MKRLDALDLEKLFELAPSRNGGANYHPDFMTWLIRAVKRGEIGEDRSGFYLDDEQRQLWRY